MENVRKLIISISTQIHVYSVSFSEQDTFTACFQVKSERLKMTSQRLKILLFFGLICMYRRVCQTQMHSGPKFKTGTKSCANIDILLKKKPFLLLLCGFSWRLTSNKLVHFPYQLMWSVDPEASLNLSNPTLTLTTNPTSRRSAPIVN